MCARHRSKRGDLLLWVPYLIDAVFLGSGGDSPAAPLIRRGLARWRRATVRIPFGCGAGLKFNAGGSAPSFALGVSEPHVQRAINELLGSRSVFYDVGANVGFHSILAARTSPNGAVYAFEPLPVNVAALRANVDLSGFTNIRIFETAISNYSGRACWCSGAEPFWGHVAEPTTFLSGKHSVPVVSLDELFASNQLAAPDVIKIDVEGHEIEVIEGMAGLLSSFRPHLIIECHGDPRILLEVLATHGYDGERIDRPINRARGRHYRASWSTRIEP